MSEKKKRPSVARVARRALVLEFVHNRAYLEELPDKDEARLVLDEIREDVESRGILDEAEPAEREFLETPIGKASKQTATDGWWRLEGLCVLVWALGRVELPPYDAGFDPRRMGSLEDLMKEPRLRKAEEIHEVSRLVTLVRWRLVELMQRRVDQMDFKGYLERYHCFRPEWLEGLTFDAKGDLVASHLEKGKRVPGKPIGEIGEHVIADLNSVNVERQIAAYWLEGDAEVYSEVQPSTLLAGIDPPNERAQAELAAEERARQEEEDRRLAGTKKLADTVGSLDDAELVRRLEALEPRLKIFEKILVGDAKKALAGGGLSQGQRARIAKILSDHGPPKG
jgi:hypothetical protein